RANRLDLEADATDAAAQPQDLNVEGIAARRALWPRPAAQDVTADHAHEVLEQCARQRQLDWRERHPPASMTQDAVLVDLGPLFLRSPLFERGESGAHVVVTRGKADPVFQRIDGYGRGAVVLQQEQTGSAHRPQCRPP